MDRRIQVKEQIKREFTMILIGSLLIGVCYRVDWFFPTRLMIMSALLINFALAVCMWYSERINRPMLYQVMIIFYLGIAAYCFVSVNETELWGAKYDGPLMAKTSVLFLMGAGLVSLVSYPALKENIKSRVDLWCPPIWPVVIAGVASYVSNKTIDNSVLRLCVLIGMSSLILTTAYKNNRTQNRSVAYKISTRHYLLYLCLFGLIAFGINQAIPKVEELPGTKLMKKLTNNWGRGIDNRLQTSCKLSRNPSQSEEIVLRVSSEKPVYLREIAYSKYQEGEWSLEEEEKSEGPVPVKESAFYSKRNIFYKALDEMSEGKLKLPELLEKYEDALKLPSNVPEEKSIYIEEVEPFKQYFTCNDVSGIKVLDEEQIGYYPYSLSFISIADEEDDVSYTVNYWDYPLKLGTRESAVLKTLSQSEFNTILEAMHPNGVTNDMPGELKQGWLLNYYSKELFERYLKLPNNIEDKLIGYANQLAGDLEGDMTKAEVICNHLKRSGEFTYQLGAPYVDEKQDPVIDFLFLGKAGICQDFASSMTLLCRAVGLPARYVVGYYASERDWEKEQAYIVRQKDAHAFVEVYIGGYGWMTFDPTPVSMKAEDLIGGDIGQLANHNITNNVGELRSLFIVIGILLCIFCWLYPIAWLRSLVWKWYILRLPTPKSIDLIMQQTLKLLEDKSIYLQERETVSKLAKRLSEQYLIDITPITKPFENYYYGGKQPDQKEMLLATECYNQLKKKKKWQSLADPNSGA